MADIAAWIKQHKTAVAGGTAGVVLLFILLRRSGGVSSASGTASPLQIAQLQSAQNLQMAQIQAQQNVQTESGQVAIAQTDAQLQAEQNQQAVGLALSLNQSGSQNQALQEEIAYELAAQNNRNSLVTSSFPQLQWLQKQGGTQNTQASIDELALLLGEPGGVSFSGFGTTGNNNPLSSFFGGLGNGLGSGIGGLIP